MTQPTEELIIWANTDVNLPKLAGPNKTKPIDDLINKGWDFTEKPAADEFNYVLNNMGQYISYLNEDKTYTFSGDVTGSATSSGSEDINFNISVNDNSHNHTSANISDATSFNIPNMVVRRDRNGDAAATNWVGHLSGNADTADKWKTARTLTYTGFATGNGNVDGSGNVSINLSMGSGFNNSKATNGYTYLPNGMIFQWGYTNGGVTFPITFPNTCLNASLTSNNTSTNGYDYKIAASNLTATGFSITRDSDDANTYVYWFAIGF